MKTRFDGNSSVLYQFMVNFDYLMKVYEENRDAPFKTYLIGHANLLVESRTELISLPL